MIRPVTILDAAAICSIYNYYVENSCATFEEMPVSQAEMEERIRSIGGQYPYLVWDDEGIINGYAYAHRWRDRSAYRHTVETSLYVRTGLHGRGMGRALMEALLDEIRKMGIHAVISGIALPNDSCVAINEKLGFRKIAHFSEVGYKQNRWLDVGNWELLLGEASVSGQVQSVTARDQQPAASKAKG